VVTGASRGIGAAVARRFAAEGSAVVVAYYPSQQMRELAHAVVEDILGGGGRAHAVALDVADPASVAEAFRIIGDQAGPVDVLVNNAAQTLRGPLPGHDRSGPVGPVRPGIARSGERPCPEIAQVAAADPALRQADQEDPADPARYYSPGL